MSAEEGDEARHRDSDPSEPGLDAGDSSDRAAPVQQRRFSDILLDLGWVYPYVIFIAVGLAGSIGGVAWALATLAFAAAAASLPIALLIPRQHRWTRLAVAAGGAGLAGAAALGLNATRPDDSATQPTRDELAATPTAVASLAWVDLPGARLVGVDLAHADLRGARLTGADLSGTDLRNACLAGADLSEVIVAEADLKGADLAGAVLDGVESDRAQHWPTAEEQRASRACR